ncbi:MAG: hypothetical protein KY456_16040 [Chloroflexi bacterium]|nr:hypothetical protein [Chloroflexota bacterium]
MAMEPKLFEASPEEVQSFLIRARQVDPRCEEAAVRGYVREIVDAEAVLDAVNLRLAPLSVVFSASWEVEPSQ